MRCPACRARLKEQTDCPRCGSDLGRVYLATHQADRCTARAIRSLLDQQPMAAAHAIKRGLALQRSALLIALRDYLVNRQQQCAIDNLQAGLPGAASAALEGAMVLQKSPLTHALANFIAHSNGFGPATRRGAASDAEANQLPRRDGGAGIG